MPKKSLAAYAVVVTAWLAYAAISLTQPISESSKRYGLNRTTITLLSLTIILPYLLTWLAGAYAALTLSAVSTSMPQKDDRVAYRRISFGIAILLGGLIVSALIGSLRQRIGDDPSAVATLAITTNYLQVFIPLAAYAIIMLGTGRLQRASQTPGGPNVWAAAAGIGLALFFACYIWLIFTNPTRAVSASPTQPATYYLPDVAIVFSIILPFMASCVIGLIVAYRMAMYARSLTGYVFKRAALDISWGFLWLVGGSIFLQGLQSLGSTRLSGLGLFPLLVIVYVFLAAQTGGYFLLSLGAKKLAAVEAVMSKYGATADMSRPSGTPMADEAPAKNV